MSDGKHVCCHERRSIESEQRAPIVCWLKNSKEWKAFKIFSKDFNAGWTARTTWANPVGLPEYLLIKLRELIEDRTTKNVSKKFLWVQQSLRSRNETSSWKYLRSRADAVAFERKTFGAVGKCEQFATLNLSDRKLTFKSTLNQLYRNEWDEIALLNCEYRNLLIRSEQARLNGMCNGFSPEFRWFYSRDVLNWWCWGFNNNPIRWAQIS